MEFGAPLLLVLLVVVPLVAGLAALAWRRRSAAMAAWASRGLWERLLPGFEKRLLVLSVTLLAVAVGGAVLALAQPRWGASEQQVERQGVDVVFVLDTSLSMATRDVPPSRLWVAQTLVRRLAQALEQNRLALVQAEGDGVVLSPLTSDAAVIELLLDAVLPGSSATPGTEIASSLERALALFPEEGSKHPVVILVSDGEDHGSALARATDALKRRGVVVHAIGVGTREGMPLELPAFATQGRSGDVEYKRDEDGNVVVSRLVEPTLENLARETGGLYLRAASAATDLDPLVRRVDEMEKRTFESEVVTTLEERFQWPLALAIAALGLHLAVAPFRRGVATGERRT